MNFNRILWMYASGHVSRLHVVHLVKEHDIARHVYGSMMIAMELCEAIGLGLECQGRILHTLLYHDAPEVATGDIPSPTKRLISRELVDRLEESFYKRRGLSMYPLDSIEQMVVEVSDLGDLLMSCIEERRMGNRTRELADHSQGELSVSIEGVFKKVTNYMREFSNPEVWELLAFFINEWEAANARE